MFISGYTQHRDLDVATAGDAPVLLKMPFRKSDLARTVTDVLAAGGPAESAR